MTAVILVINAIIFLPVLNAALWIIIYFLGHFESKCLFQSLIYAVLPVITANIEQWIFLNNVI